MALIYCSKCGKQVSDRAASCPNCGASIAPVPKYGNHQPQPQTIPQQQYVSQSHSKPQIVEDEPKSKRIKRKVTNVLAIVVGIVVIGGSLVCNNSTSTQSEVYSRDTVAYWVQVPASSNNYSSLIAITNSISTVIIDGHEYRLIMVIGVGVDNINKNAGTYYNVGLIDGQSFIRNEQDGVSAFNTVYFGKLVDGNALFKIKGKDKTISAKMSLAYGGVFSIEFPSMNMKQHVDFGSEIISAKRFDITVPTVDGDKTFHFNKPIKRE